MIMIIIIIIIISFMQGIYTYIPETNYVAMEYSVAAILLLLFMVLISLVSMLNVLYFYISTFRSMCAVPDIAVFCSSFTSCFPGMLLTYFLNDSETVPCAPIITGITCVFYIPHALHLCWKRIIIIIIVIIFIVVIIIISELKQYFLFMLGVLLLLLLLLLFLISSGAFLQSVSHCIPPQVTTRLLHLSVNSRSLKHWTLQALKTKSPLPLFLWAQWPVCWMEGSCRYDVVIIPLK